MDNELALLNEKVDRLTELVEAQNKRQQPFVELQQDMMPIANSVIKLSIDELAEIGNDFELEDLLFLLKRLLRNTNSLLVMLEQMESLMDMSQEVSILGKQVFSRSVEYLDQMEREGYFDMARGGWYIMERIVDEFDEEDVHALGDNIVTILTTVRNMTQPDVLALANNAIGAISEETEEPESLSTWQLLRELRDPKVRKGMSRMLNLLKVLADEPMPYEINKKEN
jgi:uncharacterized protein YjgD (DUF1641 family)